MSEKFFITIGRQFGSNGRAIGKLIADELGLAFYDKELIALAAEKSGMNKELFEQMDEKSSHSLFGGLLGLRNSQLDEVYGQNYLCNETLFGIQSNLIRELAGKESAVFVGRCADYILKDEPHGLHIFMYAPLDARIEKVAGEYQLSAKESRALIQKTDKSRAAYYNYYTSKEWGAISSYDICINSALLGLEGSAQLLIQLIQQKFKLRFL